MKYLFILYLSLLTVHASAQQVLEAYIKTGLENNLALLQHEADYRQSLQALKEARGLFYPSVSLNARYTVSEGGRVIDFPVGDLMNPVYSTLNQLTASSMFPQVENQEIRFLRPTEHETKIRLVQPVFNTDVYYNARIKKEMAAVEQISLEQYRRELTAEIKKAYYQVGMTGSVLEMFTQTRALLEENVRVNQSLVENHKITMDNLFRSQTELSKFEQTLQQAKKNRAVACAYFNFLLNRTLTDSVHVEAPLPLLDFDTGERDYIDMALSNREEIRNLGQYCHMSDLAVRMNHSAKFPNLYAVADYGFQGEEYVFNGDNDYLQASLVLSWNLFSGWQNQSKIKQAVIAREKLDHQLSEVKNKISLQVISAMREAEASAKGLQAAADQVSTAREGFRLTRRRYDEGQASLLEFMDARHALTQAEENLIISQYTLLSNIAELEKVTANVNQ